ARSSRRKSSISSAASRSSSRRGAWRAARSSPSSSAPSTRAEYDRASGVRVMPKRNIILRVVEMWHNTVLDERCFQKGGVVVGYGPRADFPTAGNLGLPPLFKLFRKKWKGWTVTLAPGMTGDLCVGGETPPVPNIL